MAIMEGSEKPDRRRECFPPFCQSWFIESVKPGGRRIAPILNLVKHGSPAYGLMADKNQIRIELD